MVDLAGYSQEAPDWRAILKKNKAKSRHVIIFFIALYVSVGLLIDVFLYSHAYPAATLSQILQALITLQVTPFGTLTMGGVAAVSLFITYAAHNRIMLLGTQYHELTADSARSIEEKQLYNVAEEMKMAAGLRFMPRIYVIDADYMNAFASGFSEKSAMMAMTTGLLYKLNRSELQAVMAHELSHIRHLDIKLTLTVSVLSSIMLIAIDILFYSVLYGGRGRNRDNRFFLIIIFLRYLLPLITVLLSLYLSRTREYMADAGCVELMRDNQPLASALMKIHEDHQANAEEYAYQYGDTPHEEVRRAAYLYDPVKAGVEPVKDITSAFSTHPSISDRLRAIGFNKKS